MVTKIKASSCTKRYLTVDPCELITVLASDKHNLNLLPFQSCHQLWFAQNRNPPSLLCSCSDSGHESFSSAASPLPKSSGAESSPGKRQVEPIRSFDNLSFDSFLSRSACKHFIRESSSPTSSHSPVCSLSFRNRPGGD
jgi:hypothetical protein